MSSSDCNRIAQQVLTAMERQEPFTLPMMTVADLGRVLDCLKAAELAA